LQGERVKLQVAIIEKLSASLLIKSFLEPSHNQEQELEQKQEQKWDWLWELKFIKMALMFMTCVY